ncbi:hypothetical protein R3P38DRAFT_3531571 [Favolaschia claudopus]|uniref:Uncharacterized protein n=1 Tax=Favolaschia claudopus TaxID=2862362 RepID=A0AAW0BK99_9AGAR
MSVTGGLSAAHKRGLRAVGLGSFSKHFILILSNLHEQQSSEFDLSFLSSPPPTLPNESSSIDSASQSSVTGAPTTQNVECSIENGYPSSELYFPTTRSSPSATTVSDLPDLSFPPTFPSLPAKPPLAEFLRSPKITDNVSLKLLAGVDPDLGFVTVVTSCAFPHAPMGNDTRCGPRAGLETQHVYEKFKAYRKAKLLARTSSWRNSPPSFASSPDAHATYALWQAVKAMFADGGFCDRSSPPRKDALSSGDEHRASTLSQNELYTKLTQLAAYLL